MNTRDVVRLARESLTYAQPAIPELSLKELGEKRYLTVEGRRALAYVRVPGKVRFFLDEAVYADAGRTLLPEIGGYATGLLDHLLRAGLQVHVSGGQASVALEGTSVVGEARVHVYGEDQHGVRRELGSVALGAGSVQVPAGIKHVAAVLRAQDAAGPFVATGEATIE